jgi:hypothetical protein
MPSSDSIICARFAPPMDGNSRVVFRTVTMTGGSISLGRPRDLDRTMIIEESADDSNYFRGHM